MTNRKQMDSASSAADAVHTGLPRGVVEASLHEPAKRRPPSTLVPLIKSQRNRILKHVGVLEAVREGVRTTDGETRTAFEDWVRREEKTHGELIHRLDELLRELVR